MAPAERVLLLGNLCVDHVYTVASFPKEDTGQRSLAARKAAGGNGCNSSRVLAQLRGQRSSVSWLGPVPRRTEPDTAFALEQLRAAGVDTSLLEEVGGDGLPTTFIISSQQSGSRTIVSTRHGVREMGAPHFVAALRRAFDEQAEELGMPAWCHLECRQLPAVMLEFATSWRAETRARSLTLPLSLEVEKPSMDPDKLLPLLGVCDYIFISQEYVEAHFDGVVPPSEDVKAEAPPSKRPRLGNGDECDWEQHMAMRFLRALNERAGNTQAVWICGWGALGAFALEAASGRGLFEPAHRQPRVVDSVGAGDTLIAASIHALLSGANTASTLRCGCAVAGRKVSQEGFGGLRAALPPELA